MARNLPPEVREGNQHAATTAPPQQASLAQLRPAFGGIVPRPPHPATVVQPKFAFVARRTLPPHPAIVVQSKQAFSARARLPPHPGTLAPVHVAQPAYLNALVGGGAPPAPAPAPAPAVAPAPAAAPPPQPVPQYTDHWLNYHHRADQLIVENNEDAIARDIRRGIPAATPDDTKVVVNYDYDSAAYLRYLVVVAFYRAGGRIRFHSARRANQRGHQYDNTDIVLNMNW